MAGEKDETGALAAQLAELQARVAQFEGEKKAAERDAREKAEKKAAEALAAAQAEAKKAADELASERKKFNDERKSALIWEALRGGAIKDADGDGGRPLRMHDDRDLLRMFSADVEKIELKDGALPADFHGTVRGWAKAKPHLFAVGDDGAKDDGKSHGTGGGHPPGAGRPRGDTASADDKLREKARADVAALFPALAKK